MHFFGFHGPVACQSAAVCWLRSACDVFKELHGLTVEEEEFIPFGGMGENRFLQGVANKHGVADFDIEVAKQRFFDIYINTYVNSSIGYPGEHMCKG